jgi:hypothetical protein
MAEPLSRCKMLSPFLGRCKESCCYTQRSMPTALHGPHLGAEYPGTTMPLRWGVTVCLSFADSPFSHSLKNRDRLLEPSQFLRGTVVRASILNKRRQTRNTSNTCKTVYLRSLAADPCGTRWGGSAIPTPGRTAITQREWWAERTGAPGRRRPFKTLPTNERKTRMIK